MTLNDKRGIISEESPLEPLITVSPGGTQTENTMVTHQAKETSPDSTDIELESYYITNIQVKDSDYISFAKFMYNIFVNTTKGIASFINPLSYFKQNTINNKELTISKSGSPVSGSIDFNSSLIIDLSEINALFSHYIINDFNSTKLVGEKDNSEHPS